MNGFSLKKACQMKCIAVIVILLVFVMATLTFGCQNDTSDEQPPATSSPAVDQTSPPAPESQVIPKEIPKPVPEPAPSVPETPPVVEPSPGQISFSATPDIEELEDVHWISPGKVEVDNLYPGATAEYPVTVHNGGDTATVFSVSVRQPDNTAEGFAPLPEEYFDWITVETPELELEAKQTADVLIIINMPEDANYPGQKAEFWISVIDQGQGGMVRTELACRWLVTTK